MLDQIISLWFSVSYSIRYAIWLGGGFLFFFAIAFLWYRLSRYVLGYRRFKGVWFDRRQYQALIDRLVAYQQESNRVLDADEIALLRRHLLGRFSPVHKDRGGR